MLLVLAFLLNWSPQFERPESTLCQVPLVFSMTSVNDTCTLSFPGHIKAIEHAHESIKDDLQSLPLLGQRKLFYHNLVPSGCWSFGSSGVYHYLESPVQFSSFTPPQSYRNNSSRVFLRVDAVLSFFNLHSVLITNSMIITIYR